MGFARKQTKKEVCASPSLVGGRSRGSIENPRVPLDVVPARALVHPRAAAAMKFLTDVKAAGAGTDMYRKMLLLVWDYRERGHLQSLITGGEELFKGHPDLLVAFNAFLPEGYHCTVPE